MRSQRSPWPPIFIESEMPKFNSNRSKCVRQWTVTLFSASSILLAAVTTTVEAQDGLYDVPFDHPLVLGESNICTKDTSYGPDVLRWTADVRVLAVQPLGNLNYDMIIDASDGNVFVSQYQSPGDVDFVLFDGSAISNEDPRAAPEITTRIYHNQSDVVQPFYTHYVRARSFDYWDGKSGYADASMFYYDLVQARRIYLKAGTAYRFGIERKDPKQTGFASLIPTSPFNRIQTRPAAVGEMRWWNGGQDELVIAPEEGWYTLVIVQTSGSALGAAFVRNTVVVPRGPERVDDNSAWITVRAE